MLALEVLTNDVIKGCWVIIAIIIMSQQQALGYPLMVWHGPDTWGHSAGEAANLAFQRIRLWQQPPHNFRVLCNTVIIDTQ